MRVSNGGRPRRRRTVGGDEHRVPASGPAERRRGALHVGAALGGRRIVGRVTARSWVRKACGASRRAARCLRVDAAGSGHRVASRGEHAGRADDVRDRFGADVAGGAVAHAVGRRECSARRRDACRGRRRRSAAARVPSFSISTMKSARSPSLASRSRRGVQGSTTVPSVAVQRGDRGSACADRLRATRLPATRLCRR